MPNGIHHVTGITRRVQANVDFYAGFLGLRLVKRTGGFEDAEQLHLLYGFNYFFRIRKKFQSLSSQINLPVNPVKQRKT